MNLLDTYQYAQQGTNPTPTKEVIINISLFADEESKS